MIKRKILLISSFNLLMVFFFNLNFAFAEYGYKLLEHVPLIGSGEISFEDYITGLYKFFIASVFVAALLMITIGGYFYIISAGNQARAGNAKEIIWNAIIGLLAVLFIAILFKAINGNLFKFQPKFPDKLKDHGYEAEGKKQ